MTENEALKTLEDLQRLLTNYRHISKDLTEANGIAIKALEEIQAYRAIGLTPELIEAMQGHNIALINDLGEYQQIGTIEEFKALKEKSVAKKPINIQKHHCGLFDIGNCPCCAEIVTEDEIVCEVCFQALDWK